jgi:predicted nucleic acid-binding protein
MKTPAVEVNQCNRPIGARATPIVISTQVLQEFYVTVTRKLSPALSAEEAEQQVQNFSAFEVIAIDVPLTRSAITLAREHTLSLWDALVVESARARDCSRVLTEDLQHGREFGRLRIENPFADL